MKEKLNERSILGGAKETGDIAENEFQRVYPEAVRNPDEKGEWDFNLNGNKIDVKSKRVISLPAKPDWQVSVSDDQKDFDVDFYVFIFISRQDEKILEWVGWMSKDEYFKKAKLRKKGEVAPENGFVSPKDNWYLPISELHHNFTHK